MPKITVGAIVMRKDAMLFLRARGEEEWRLPSGPLLDSDESVESAVRRLLKDQYGVRSLIEEPVFITTAYEFHGDETTTLHNLFAVAPGSKLRPSGGTEQRWLKREEIDTAALPEWLAAALTIAPEDEADFDFGLEAFQSLLELAQQAPGSPGSSGLILPPGFAAGGHLPALAARDAELAGDRLMPEPAELAPVYVINGPAGAGKTTVALELCRRFPQSAHVDLDALYHLVIGGYVRPGHGESNEAQRASLTSLCYENASSLTISFAEAGFTTVIHGVFETRNDLDEFLGELFMVDDEFQVRVVTLLPDAATLRARDQGRPEEQRMHGRSEELRRIIEKNGDKRGIRLDTSAWTVEQTVDVILERQEQALIDPDTVDLL